ncbi:calcium/proton exchanger [Tanacetum coccineum]|uniref:Calcium/proton exchanger n=1 Tax=Tanacetum coccineum TaxID=301880 RepID=A0ABQ4WV47_9ASTR
MKIMLANYGVANGYQFWYKRNDYKSLLVLCGRNVKEGRCTSKVGRKGIKENVSKGNGKENVAKAKGKEKVAEGSKATEGNKKWTKQGIKLSKSPCKEKAVEGNMKWTKQGIKLSKSPSEKRTKRKTSDNVCKFWTLVMYKWIAKHYVREIISNPKISYIDLQASIREKFLINVSLAQVRRANKELYMILKVVKPTSKGSMYALKGLKEAMDRSCGAFKNGICESYNAAIVNQRARGLTDIITPSVRKELEKLKDYLRLWEVFPSGYREFEIKKLNEGYGVNLETHKCTCRLWDLTGIPCIHGVVANAFLMKDPVDGVSECCSKRAWQNSYSSFILPVGGQSMWVKSGLPPPMPPKKRTMPGKPK